MAWPKLSGRTSTKRADASGAGGLLGAALGSGSRIRREDYRVSVAALVLETIALWWLQGAFCVECERRSVSENGFGGEALKMPLRVGGESFAGLVKTQGSARQTRATLGCLLWPFQGVALRAFGSEARRMAYE